MHAIDNLNGLAQHGDKKLHREYLVHSADGPSLEVAPSGTCIYACFLKEVLVSNKKGSRVGGVSNRRTYVAHLTCPMKAWLAVFFDRGLQDGFNKKSGAHYLTIKNEPGKGFGSI